MHPDQITIIIVDIDLGFTGADLQLLLQILAGHGIVNRIEGKREIRTNGDLLPNQILMSYY